MPGDKAISVTQVKDDWDTVLNALNVCKEFAPALMKHEMECIIRGIQNELLRTELVIRVKEMK